MHVKIIFRRKAEEGVQIYILIFNDTNVLDYGNTEAMAYYNKLMPKNFYYINRSGIAATEWKFFAHHEKCVVVDDQIGFISGLDLALGRFEVFKKYPLFDRHSFIFPFWFSQ